MEILNLEGHLNRIAGSKVTAILLNEWFLPIGEASAVKGLRLQPAQQACFFYEYKTYGTYRINIKINPPEAAKVAILQKTKKVMVTKPMLVILSKICWLTLCNLYKTLLAASVCPSASHCQGNILLNNIRDHKNNFFVGWRFCCSDDEQNTVMISALIPQKPVANLVRKIQKIHIVFYCDPIFKKKYPCDITFSL